MPQKRPIWSFCGAENVEVGLQTKQSADCGVDRVIPGPVAGDVDRREQVGLWADVPGLALGLDHVEGLGDDQQGGGHVGG